MRTAILILAAVSSASLAAPSLAQQAPAPGPVVRMMSAPRAPVPVAAPRVAPQRPGGWQPRPGTAPRSGGWKPGRPGGWRAGRPGGWKGLAQPGRRWGDKIQGRWHAGWRAPGGWGAYRRPVRGWTLPRYWIAGGFWITDWSGWGLSSPPYGYNWVRYYDDAVLVDRGGRVWDSVSGLDWDRDDDRGYDGSDYDDRDDGYGADYDAPDDDGPGYEDRGPPPPPPAYAVPGRPMRCIANCTYYAAPGTTTTIVIQSAPVVTTTTVTEEVVSYGGRKVMRRSPTKTLYRAPARVKTKTCDCR